MPEVVGDPDVIESFSRELDQYCRDMVEALLRVRAQLVAMENDRTWADERYRQYMSMFDDASSVLRGVVERMREEHTMHLNDVVQRLRAYHES
jgi:hypothetical protein